MATGAMVESTAGLLILDLERSIIVSDACCAVTTITEIRINMVNK
jgi:hypothetical protein